MNQFGGDWTQIKIDIVEAYARAYLTIMNKYPSLKTIYFDGFAGSGEAGLRIANDVIRKRMK